MRSLLVIPVAIIIPLLTIHLLKSLTGDALIGVVLAMTISVTVAALLSGLPASPRRSARRR